MMEVVDIADMVVSGNPQDVLVTHSLGSCIGVTIWDPEVHVGGMIHYMLPSSTIAPEKARTNPAMFADTGIPAMFRAAYELGAAKKRIIAKVAGGSSLLDDKGMFNIGKRNYIALRKIFWKNGILIEAEDVGGDHSRTLRLSVADGRVTVKKRDGEVEL
ncbi:MAG TPA: chemotaxis protein CheD [Phycisphaerae bacterium]|nr:chemotaxis protein CheD [Phycisphaerae bacterium]HRY66418.1 chemotaxis protein CheD [Phycisphaerae bacterium]HSA25874.1 chemotaxis protein CheD [Phycisphaerae bacterium]